MAEMAKELQTVKLSLFGISCSGLYYNHIGLPKNYRWQAIAHYSLGLVLYGME